MAVAQYDAGEGGMCNARCNEEVGMYSEGLGKREKMMAWRSRNRVKSQGLTRQVAH